VNGLRRYDLVEVHVDNTIVKSVDANWSARQSLLQGQRMRVNEVVASSQKLGGSIVIKSKLNDEVAWFLSELLVTLFGISEDSLLGVARFNFDELLLGNSELGATIWLDSFLMIFHTFG